MRILAIETSCDDTCMAVLEIERQKVCSVKSEAGPSSLQKVGIFHTVNILSDVVSSQIEVHRKYGGVYPTMAIREHKRNLKPVFERATKSIKDVDLIAVTVGPGLEPCLWVGVNFAKELCGKWNLPIIPVNHIEAHILVNWLSSIESKFQISDFKFQTRANFQAQILRQIGFPVVCLVVSGGHTQLILMRDIGKYRVLGETRDDAAGECFDKTARILGLPYPGGPAIAEIASQWKSQIPSIKSQINPKHQVPSSKFDIKLPRPMLYSKDYDFSFSGLKTAVLYDFKKRPQKIRKSKGYIQEMCVEIQQAIIDVLVSKTIKAAKEYKAKAIILGGGVSANDELRKQFKLKIKSSYFARKQVKSKIDFFAPPKKFCTDNAVMVGLTAYYHRKNKTKNWKSIKADANLRI